MLERNYKLINKKFFQYLIPSIITIFAMQIASLLDGIIVGNLIGVDALSATGLVLPILYVIQMPGFALGVGGSIVVGKLLGERDIKKANKAFSACVIYAVLLSIIFAVIAPLVSGPLASLFSNDPIIVKYGEDFIFAYMITDPIITIALLLSSFMSVDNNPKLSSAFFIIANIVKIGSMFLFINVFDWGMIGACISTAFGYFIGFGVIFFYIRSDKRLLKLTLGIKDTFADLKASLKASSATAIQMFLTAVQMIIVNIILGNVITETNDLLVFGLISNMVFVFDLLAGGIQGVIPTICGILNGEKDYGSLKTVVRKIYIINLIIPIVLVLLIGIFPNVYASIYNYTETDPALVRNANIIMRTYLLSFVPYELNKFTTSYYPAIDKILPSYVTVFLRELILVLPLTITLLITNGLFGYAISQALTEILTVIITYVFVLIYGKTKKKGHGLFLFEDVDYISYDVSVDNNIDNASIISADIIKFALDNKIDNRNAQILGLACEEMVSNIIYYGYKRNKQNFIDVNLKISDGIMLLRIRDDGLPFDPTKYEFDQNEQYSISGIKLIEGLTDKMTYMRILSLNNTIMEVNLKKEKENGNFS